MVGTHVQVSVALKHLDRRVLASIVDVPVVNTVGRDEAKSRLADPLPVLDILAHSAGFELLLLFEIEDLQRPGLCLEGNDLFLPVHDGTVGLDGSPRNIVVVLELDNDDLGLGCFALLLPDAHVRVGFECL